MFWNSDKTNGSGGSAVTIIGPGVSVKGDVAFSGYLRVQGEIVGNVTCNSDTQGTIVIHGPGSITGGIHAPNIVVGGRVNGPLHALDSVEIHNGATVTGDVRYRRLSIEAGGALDGALFPTAIPAAESATQERRIAVPEAPTIKALDGPHAHERRASDHFWTPHKIAIAAAVILAIVVMLWPGKMQTDIPPPVAVIADPEAAPRIAPEAAQVAAAPKVVEPAPVTPEPRVETAAAPLAPPAAPQPTSAPESRQADPGRILTVEGMEPGKPADLFFVSAREPVVLYQKQRDDSGEGKRIDVGRGAKKRFAISEREVVRVAEGDNLDLYYQGRKVPPRIVHSGAWIAFEPLGPKGTAQ